MLLLTWSQMTMRISQIPPRLDRLAATATPPTTVPAANAPANFRKSLRDESLFASDKCHPSYVIRPSQLIAYVLMHASMQLLVGLSRLPEASQQWNALGSCLCLGNATPDGSEGVDAGNPQPPRSKPKIRRGNPSIVGKPNLHESRSARCSGRCG